MAANGTVLLAGLETRHGRAYALALLAGGYRVKALVSKTPADQAGQAGQAGLPMQADRAAARGVEPVPVELADGRALRRLVTSTEVVLIALDGRDSEGRTVEEQTTRALIQAASEQRVPILYSSLLHADRQTGVPALALKGRLELVARRSGSPVTILRPGMLTDVFDDPAVRDRVTRDGVLASGIAVDVPVSYLAPDDLGLLAVLALEVPGLRGATLDLGGPQVVTFRELIPRLWRMTGHSVTYEQLSPQEIHGRSDDEGARLVQHINADGYAVDMRPLLERVPVRLTTLDDYLTARGWATRPERVAA